MRAFIIAIAFAALSAATRDGDCSVQPAGTGPTVNNPDTPAAFLAYQPFADAANSANTPQGYTLAFTNLQAATQTSNYLGVLTLSSYDPAACASFCAQQAGCVAFDIYFERDPTLNPNTVNCPDPGSLTNIQCTRWGVAINAGTATNTGQSRDSFQVVIAGSNGYNSDGGSPTDTCS